MHVLEQETVARRLAAIKGLTVDEVIREAVEARAHEAGVQVPGPRLRRTAEERIAAIIAISDRCAALPVLDPRTSDEIIGYDEFGIPQ